MTLFNQNAAFQKKYSLGSKKIISGAQRIRAYAPHENCSSEDSTVGSVYARITTCSTRRMPRDKRTTQRLQRETRVQTQGIVLPDRWREILWNNPACTVIAVFDHELCLVIATAITSTRRRRHATTTTTSRCEPAQLAPQKPQHHSSFSAIVTFPQRTLRDLPLTVLRHVFCSNSDEHVKVIAGLLHCNHVWSRQKQLGAGRQAEKKKTQTCPGNSSRSGSSRAFSHSRNSFSPRLVTSSSLNGCFAPPPLSPCCGSATPTPKAECPDAAQNALSTSQALTMPMPLTPSV